jgi:phospholysine phosphohistidine inorganic pyrophosphate phosphatase
MSSAIGRTAWIPGVRGVLFDVDGTLLVNDRPIPGAPETLDRLRAREIFFRLTTNTSRRPRSAIASVLRGCGFAVENREILAPCVLARRLILGSGRTRAAFLLPEAAREDFEGVVEDETRPDWVVVGDIGRDFTWERLNQAYHWIQGGARLLALHKNRVWDNGVDGVVLDAGPFVVALEHATGSVAELVGKPARPFFDLALADLGLPAGEVMVVGDDLEADCRGGAAAGCRTALVLSGKTGRADADRAQTRPDLVLDSVADLRG